MTNGYFTHMTFVFPLICRMLYLSDILIPARQECRDTQHLTGEDQLVNQKVTTCVTDCPSSTVLCYQLHLLCTNR